MLVPITKSARQFGYVIWTGKTNAEFQRLLGNRSSVAVNFNGFLLGKKAIDWKYHRISIGYKFTRALPESASVYKLTLNNDILEVYAFHGK